MGWDDPETEGSYPLYNVPEELIDAFDGAYRGAKAYPLGEEE